MQRIVRSALTAIGILAFTLGEMAFPSDALARSPKKLPGEAQPGQSPNITGTIVGPSSFSPSREAAPTQQPEKAAPKTVPPPATQPPKRRRGHHNSATARP